MSKREDENVKKNIHDCFRAYEFQGQVVQETFVWQVMETCRKGDENERFWGRVVLATPCAHSTTGGFAGRQSCGVAREN